MPDMEGLKDTEHVYMCFMVLVVQSRFDISF